MFQEQALTGVRILDFGQALDGSFATQQLGAQVLKIKPPVGVKHFTRTDKLAFPAQQHPTAPVT